MPNQGLLAKDEQTGKTFIKITEGRLDIVAAWASILYTLFVIVYATKLLLGTWVGKYPGWFTSLYGTPSIPPAQDGSLLLPVEITYPIFKLLVYTAIGGAMGAAVNNIRSFVGWHAENKAFGWRFIWKYISMPPLGAVLAVMVYALLQGSAAVVSGSAGVESAGRLTSLTAWVTGALAGYGAHKVFIWLDVKVNNMFKVDQESPQVADVAVPDLVGKPEKEAEATLNSAKLAQGNVSKQNADKEQEGKVISQTPEAGTKVALGSKVAVSVGIVMDPEVPKVSVPDVAGTTQEEATQILVDKELALGDSLTGPTSDAQKVGRVIGQTPLANAEVAKETKVSITIGKGSESGSQAEKVKTPDVSGKSKDEAISAIQAAKLALGEVSEEQTSDEQKLGKVIRQDPIAGSEVAPGSKVGITLGIEGTEV